MASKQLDCREKRFVEEYLTDLDPKRAALEAGYSKTTAASKAYQWVSNCKVKPHVFAAVEAAKGERSERTKIDADWMLTRLGDEATADLADLYDDNGALRPVKEWPLIWRQGLVAGLDVEEIRAEGETVGTIRKVKLSDRVKRLELIGKHVSVQAFRDQLGHGGPDGGPIQTEATIADADAFTRAIAGIAAGSGAGSASGEPDAGDES